MNAIHSLRRLARRGYFRAKGFPLYAILEQLQESQYWSRAELHALQEEKLRQLVRHAYESVPFYRRRMDELNLRPADIRGLDDLPKLPMVTRRDVRQAGRELISSTGSVGKPLWHHTGGTTGEPLRTANDRRGTAWGNAAYYRGLGWAGYDLDRDRIAVLFGGSLEPQRSAQIGRRVALGLALSLSAYDIRPETLADYYEKLRRFRPRFLKGYAGAVFVLASSLAAAGYPLLKLDGVFTTSEFLPAYQRSCIEQVFRTRVFDYYGCVEINSLGYECKAHDGYHVPEEHAIIETVQDPDEEASYLEGGAFVVTDLDNYYMPLIRYRNGDAGVLTDEPCSCGRTLARVAHLYGRECDLLRSTDGNLVDGGLVDYILGNTYQIREFRLIQERENCCRLIYVPEETDSEILQVVSQLKRFLGADMNIIADRVDAIPVSGSGKRRFTVSLLAEPNGSDHRPESE